MQSLIFKSIRGSNFFRFGHEEFFFEFKKGLVGLVGENGLGKSTILDAICICIYNESYRPSTQVDWTNNMNGKGMVLGLTLELCGQLTDKYFIVRKPTAKKSSEKVMIYKNDVLMANIQDYQEYIENNIIGFNINIFRNTVAVSGSTPFISMNPEQKRKFAENLFSIKHTRDYRKKASERLSEDRLNKRVISQEISSINVKIQEYLNIIKISNSTKESEVHEIDLNIQNIDDNIAKLDKSVQNVELEISQLSDNLDTNTNALKKIDVKSIEQSYKDTQSSIMRLDVEIDMCKKEYKNGLSAIERIEPHVICTQCGNSFTEEQAKEYIEKTKKINEDVALKGKSKIIEKNELVKELTTFEDMMTRINELKSLIFSKTNEIHNRKTEINSILFTKKSLESSKSALILKRAKTIEKLNNSDVCEFAAKTVDDLRSTIVEKESDLMLVDRKIKVYEYIINMCSDDGIRKMLLQEFTPVLNSLISKYLSKFDLPIKVIFNEYFDHVLESPKGLGQKHSMLSKGQKTRINLAILFAMVDLMRMVGNVRCNLLILDEFADEGLDEHGFKAAINSIRSIADSNDKSIVLITHRRDDVMYSNLDALYELELKNNFTVMREMTTW